MHNATRVKMQVAGTDDRGGVETVHFAAVDGASDEHTNTAEGVHPRGSMSLVITDPSTARQYQKGETYYVDIMPATGG